MAWSMANTSADPLMRSFPRPVTSFSLSLFRKDAVENTKETSRCVGGLVDVHRHKACGADSRTPQKIDDLVDREGKTGFKR